MEDIEEFGAFVTKEPPQYVYVLQEICDIKTLYNCLDRGETCLDETILNSFKKYIAKHSKNIDVNTGLSKVGVYYSSKTFEDKSVGRMYPIITTDGKEPETHATRRCMTFSNYMPKKLRNTICYNMYYDIDFKNSLPSILLQLFKQNNITCISLAIYVKDRDTIFEKVIEWYNVNKDNAKTLFLSMVFGGNFETWKKDNNIETYEDYEFIIEFQNDIRTAVKKILKLEKYGRFVRYVRYLNYKNEKEKADVINPFSAITYILETIENRCLIELYNHYISLGYTIGSFEYDGLKIMKHDSNMFAIEHLQSGQKFIKDMTGFDIELAEKNIESDVELMLPDNTFVINGDKDAAIIILRRMNGSILYSNSETGKLQIYYKIDNRWNLLTHYSNLFPFVVKYTFIFFNGVKKILYSESNRNVNNITDSIIKFITLFPDYKIKDFEELFKNSTKQKLCFKNGIYDFVTREFIKWEDDRAKNIYTTIISPHEYNPDCDEKTDYMHSILSEQYGESVFPEFKKVLSRAMAGHSDDRRWVTLYGNRSSGKGFLCDLLEKSFGEYVKTASNGCLIMKKGMDDSTREFGWIIPFRRARLVKVNEIKTNAILDGMFLKAVCGSGDTVNGRLLYNECMNFKFDFTFMLCCNDIPKTDPIDANETRIAVEMPLVYTTAEVIEKESEIRRKNLRLIKPGLKQEISNDKKCINAFIKMILQSYTIERPSLPLLTEIGNNFMDSPNDTVKKILDYFIIDTSDKSLVMTVKELGDAFKIIRGVLSLSESDQKLITVLKNEGVADWRTAKQRGYKYVKFKETDPTN
jgi:hypothetical protein